MKRAFRWILTVGILVGIVFAAREIDLDALSATLGRADLWLVAAALGVCALLRMGARVGLSRQLLVRLPSEHGPIGWKRLAALHYLSRALTMVTFPASGTVLRVVELRRDHGYALGSLVGLGVVETVAQMVSAMLIAMVAAILAPPSAPWAAALLATLPGALIGATLLLGARACAARWPHSRIGRLSNTVQSFPVADYGRAVGWALIIDVADLSILLLCASALGVQLGLGAMMVVYVVMSVAIATPWVPGQIGVLEGGLALSLSAFGVAPETAVAMALLYRGIQTAPVVVGGLLVLAKRWFGNHNKAEVTA